MAISTNAAILLVLLLHQRERNIRIRRRRRIQAVKQYLLSTPRRRYRRPVRFRPNRQRVFPPAIIRIARQRRPINPRYRPPIPYQHEAFDLDRLSDIEAFEFMRFTKAEIRQILPYLALDTIAWRNRYNPSLETTFCLLLWRLSFPSRYKEQINIFGRSRAWCSSVFNDVVCHLCHRFGRFLYFDDERLTRDQLRTYSEAIRRINGAPRVWAFVDGTIRAICRPGTVHQRPYYTGYKKLHGIKFQAISTPDGLIVSLAGPFEASLGDWAAWYESEIEDKLR
jgi:DDE superfamily endonuclease